MKQKINEENIETHLVFCIDPRKAFTIKSLPRFVSQIRHIRTKYVYFLFRLNFDFWFLYKTMTKQTVYLNIFARKNRFRLQYLRPSAFKTYHCWRGLMTIQLDFQHVKCFSKFKMSMRPLYSANK